MNVFVLSAGRTASTAFSAACLHISNYSSAHESRVGILAREKLAYPQQHIEIDNRLTWFTHLLDEKYGQDAIYVHLERDREKVAKSYAQRWNLNESVVKAFGHGILMNHSIKVSQRYDICLDYVDYVNHTIEAFLRDKPLTLHMHSESLKSDFKRFWTLIKAEGNLNAALAEFDKTHNPNKTSFINKIRNAITP